MERHYFFWKKLRSSTSFPNSGLVFGLPTLPYQLQFSMALHFFFKSIEPKIFLTFPPKKSLNYEIINETGESMRDENGFNYFETTWPVQSECIWLLILGWPWESSYIHILYGLPVVSLIYPHYSPNDWKPYKLSFVILIRFFQKTI